MRTDKNRNENIFQMDMEIPPIVQNKINASLASISTKTRQSSKEPCAYHKANVSCSPRLEMEDDEMTRETKKNFFKSWTSVAAAAAVVVLLGGGLAFAAINHFWSDGIQEVLEMNEDQMQTLAEQGNVQVFDDTDAVTVDGVMIRPMEMVADRNAAILTFLVSGVEEGVTSGERLLFDSFHVELDEGSFYGASGSFYNDKVTDENGTEGFEYIIRIDSVGDGNMVSSLGRQAHITLTDLALDGGKAEYGEVLTAGTWEFDMSLPAEDPAMTFDVEYPLSETVYTVDRIVLSPLSIQVYYQVNGEVEIGKEDTNVPIIHGIRLKDGTVIDSTSELESGYPAFEMSPGSYLYDDPEEAYTNEEVRLHPDRAFAQARFNRAMNPEDIAEVILQPWGDAYVWGDLPDEIVAQEYGGEIPFERVDVDNIEYWYVPLE